MSNIAIELAGPAARAAADLPDDVPLEHLIPTIVTLVGDGCPAEGRWYAYRPGGVRIDVSKTLGQASVGSGETVFVTRATTAIDPHLPDPVPAVTDRDTPSMRSARILPSRMSTSRRLAASVRAWLGTRVTPEAIDDGPLGRAIAMWHWSEHRHRLSWMIGRPQLHRTITIGVVTQADAGSSARTAVDVAGALGEGRADRVILLDGDPIRAGVTRLAEDPLPIGGLADGTSSLDARFGSGSRPVTTIGCDLGCAEQPTFDAYRRVIDRIRPNAGVVVIDCGPVGASRLADLCEQIVLVTDRPVDREVERRFRHRPTVVAITPQSDPSNLEQIDRSIPGAVGAVVQRDQVAAAHEVAALLAAGWAALGATV